jgi:hypothetical protein
MRAERKERRAKRTLVKSEESAAGGWLGNFAPSTGDELKDYARRARKRERMKKSVKDKARMGKFVPEKLERIENFRKRRFIRIFIKILKERIAATKERKADPRWIPRLPRYRHYSDEATSDANFCHEIHGALAHFSWPQLKRLVKAGSRDEFDLTNYSKTFRLADRMVHQALGLVSDREGVRYRLKNREQTLATWPIKPEEKQVSKKEKSTEEVVSKKKKKSAEEAPAKEASSKKSKKDKGEKKAKKGKRIRITDETRFKVVKKFEGGVREQTQSTITGNTSYAAIVKRCKKEHSLPEPKVRGYISWLLSNGYVSAS